MKVFIEKDYEAMSDRTVQHMLDTFFGDYSKRVNVSITNGRTPVRAYEKLVEIVQTANLDHVHFYNFDEIGVKGEVNGITRAALNQMFFDPARIKLANIHALDLHNWATFDQKIEQDGGIDLIVIGVGTDGHFCGNLSGTLKHFGEGVKTVAVDFNDFIYQRMLHHCGTPERMEDYYVTFGPRSVMNCQKILVIANGDEKADIMKKTLEGPIDLSIPSSILQLHPNVTFILDEAAASKLTK